MPKFLSFHIIACMTRQEIERLVKRFVRESSDGVSNLRVQCNTMVGKMVCEWEAPDGETLVKWLARLNVRFRSPSEWFMQVQIESVAEKMQAAPSVSALRSQPTAVLPTRTTPPGNYRILFAPFEVPGLSHYSYVIGCPDVGQVAVIDPKRDVDTYLGFAQGHNVKITHVLETHIHADYASGAFELVQRTGAQLWLSAYDQGETYVVACPHQRLHDGESLTIGSVRLQALHTPGHTPEHLSFLVYDTITDGEAPLLMLTGDFLFAGSTGRPDLLGEPAKYHLAGELFESICAKLKKLPARLPFYPAHGAGSLCGSGISTVPFSTLETEYLQNPYLDPNLTKEQFVTKILASTPPFPPYFKLMKKINAAGPPLLKELPSLKAIAPQQFQEMIAGGHVVLDLRSQLSFGAGHIPRSFGIGQGDFLSTWAAWVVPYDAPLLLVPCENEDLQEAVRSLIRVGLDNIAGYLHNGISAWYRENLPVTELPQLELAQAAQLYHERSLQILDVRTDEEVQAGHIPGSLHIMGGMLTEQMERLGDKTSKIAVICSNGYRSTIAASVLERAGFLNLYNMAGMQAWEMAGLPVKKGTAPGS